MKLSATILILVGLSLPCSDMTLGELVDVFEAQEFSLGDVVVEYEWCTQRRLTPEDGRGADHLSPVSREVCSFATARSFSDLQSYSCKMDLCTEAATWFRRR